MEQKNKGEYMNELLHSSTLSAEEVLTQAISPEKKQELTERLTKLKATLNQIESRMVEEQLQSRNVNSQVTPQDELARRISILERISSETRANIATIIQIQLSEKYHPGLNLMIKNLERTNQAYGMILDGLIK